MHRESPVANILESKDLGSSRKPPCRVFFEPSEKGRNSLPLSSLLIVKFSTFTV